MARGKGGKFVKFNNPEDLVDNMTARDPDAAAEVIVPDAQENAEGSVDAAPFDGPESAAIETVDAAAVETVDATAVETVDATAVETVGNGNAEVDAPSIKESHHDRKLYVELTDSEKAQIADTAATLFRRMDDLETELKDVKADFSQRRKDIEEELSSIMTRVRKGDERTVRCRMQFNYEMRIVKVFRTDTGEMIEERDMRTNELQMELDFNNAAADVPVDGAAADVPVDGAAADNNFIGAVDNG